MQLPATSTPLPVLTVQFSGLYVFAKYDVEAGPGLSIFVNGSDISLSPERVVYLKAGDAITHSGSAGKLAGVRLGDELSE